MSCCSTYLVSFRRYATCVLVDRVRSSKYSPSWEDCSYLYVRRRKLLSRCALYVSRLLSSLCHAHFLGRVRSSACSPSWEGCSHMYVRRRMLLSRCTLYVFSADMIFPTMLPPHRTTNPATTGILTQLSEDTGYLWCALLPPRTDTSSCIRLAVWPHFPGLTFSLIGHSKLK